jgi:pilus assembly protein CpaC
MARFPTRAGMPGTLRRLAAIVLAATLVAGAARSADATEVVDTGASTIALERNQGVLVRLDRAVNSVFVADAEIADVQVKSPRLVYVFGKRAGETTLFAVDQSDQVVVNERLQVRHNLRGLQQALREILPAEPVEARAVGGSVMLTGYVSSAAAAEDARLLAARFAGADNVINRVKVNSANQVNLRVRIAEVSREVSKSFGVRWNALLGGEDGSGTFFSPGNFSGRNDASFADDFIPGASALFNDPAAFGLGTAFAIGDASIDAMLDVLAQEGLVSVLAEPNLTALSGETATFLAGGEFPVPVAADEDRISLEFKQFGVQLEFTPTLLGDDRISLAVAPEVSEIDRQESVELVGTVIPGISTRRASTTVELASGQSFAIAGLLSSEQDHGIDKLPGLGNLPVLGALFRSDRFQRGETELAIIVTPYIVEPVSRQKLSAPTDGLMPPNDIERILFGKLVGQSEQAAAGREALAGQQLVGPVGFMLE